MLLQKNARNYHASVPSNVAFSLQTDKSARPVPTKGKRPYNVIIAIQQTNY